MKDLTDYAPGVRFALRGDDHQLEVDAEHGRLVLTTHRLIGSPTVRTLGSASVRAITIELNQAPKISFALGAKLLSQAFQASDAGASDPEALGRDLPRGLLIRIDSNEAEEPLIAHFALPEQVEERDVVAAAYQLADAARLPHAGVFRARLAGLEVRLARHPSPRLGPSPPAGADLAAAASAALSEPEPPPFDPASFQSDYRVAEWSPGQRAVFQRPMSKAAPFVAPFILLVLIGPLAFFAGLETVPALVATLLGLAIGGGGLGILVSLLPRQVEADWPARTLSIRSWLRSKTLSFDNMEALELVGHNASTGGGEGGSGRISYWCSLNVLERAAVGGAPVSHELFETNHEEEPDAPYRVGVPLLEELGAALGVERRVADYSFRMRDK